MEEFNEEVNVTESDEERDEDINLAEACAKDSEEKIRRCIQYAYYSNYLKGLARPAYGADPDLFLRLLKKVHFDYECMSLILISVKGLRNGGRDGFADDRFKEYYRLEEILPFYEAFVQR
ncbi:hypothetical protein Ciccas_013363, partial [Cichlidogyrus casuarinus]